MRFRQKYAPSVVNNSIGTLRAVFDEAISTGARFNDPAAGLARVKARQKQLEFFRHASSFCALLTRFVLQGPANRKIAPTSCGFWPIAGFGLAKLGM